MRKVRGLRSDEGYATITSAGIIAAVMSLCALVAGVGAHVAATHRAQVAADLAAISGAEALYQGKDACQVVAETAVANSASVTSCEVDGQDVLVTATVGTASARARAGPL